MKREALCFAVILLSGLLILSTAAAAEQTISQTVTKQVIITNEAAKLPPKDVVKKDGAKISEEEALKIINGAFPHITGDGTPDIQLDYDSYQGRNIWRINNYERTGRGLRSSAGYNASLDADTGEILYMHCQNTRNREIKGIVQRLEAQKTAEQLVRKLQPALYEKLQLQKSTPAYYYPQPNLNITHSFQWARVENGIEIDHDGIYVTVDALSGQVISYNFNWQPKVKLPAVGTPVSAGELSVKVINELGMALIYQFPYRNFSGANPEAKLIYQFNAQGQMFNASNGKAVDYQGRDREIKEIRMFEEIPQTKGINNPITAPGQRMTVDKATATAENFFRALGIKGEVTRSGGGSSSGPMGKEEYWSFSIGGDQGGAYPERQLGIEVTTGRVANYHEYGPDMQADAASSKITREEAMVKAGEFINKVAPEYSPYLSPEKAQLDLYGSEQDYSFHFYRVVNGIPFPQDGIHIVVSRAGKIRGYNCEWHKVSFPAAQNVITPGEAARKWLELSPLQLAYFFPRDGEKPGSQAILVYRPDNTLFNAIDAVTGKPVANDGAPASPVNGNGYSFTHSWAAQYLEILAGSGILPPPEQFSPTDTVKKRDAARLITAVMNSNYGYDESSDKQFQDINPDDPDYNAIQTGALLGVYDKGGSFSPEQKVTRLTLARWMVDAMGCAEAANISNNIESSYEDISTLSAKDRNYIGLAQGLGIMRGDENGRFNPTDNVTWEELAAVVINSAPKLRNKSGMW
jgi:hypothetical protein